MVRSAAALAAVLIIPSLALAQEPQGTVSSARVMSMRGDVFRQGVVLRLVRTMN